ncbi:Glu/Leu/Phe/Val dehydrogenase [Seongchinamella unica]|uniref:Glu/Leu/Phe/Val dehydrogenase n=1 Tax=Seongchinamella unica TaxID=2547392 RepID=A0A4R5LP59_9GAMM|nr:Glu/Leu/Phe/Val dehydrogenase dimerization domain-containing protein [Seongchinamella unica]TDG12153.1 Glu/Leu/Phe/Val dehydrogenase [Seongchinamella unica]
MFDHPEFDNHERVTFVRDQASGLRAINAIHRTRSIGAGGGVRFRTYNSEQEALTDVLRLSRAMTYKLALSGLPHGGAKTVIIGDPRTEKTPELLKAFGRYVDSLEGVYTCAPDVGTTTEDMDTIGEVCRFVLGKSDQGGNTCVPTALGVFNGLRAVASHVFGSDDLTGLRVAIQGAGGVGAHLAGHLADAGAEILIADIDTAAAEDTAARTGATVVGCDEILFADADILSPNALGAVFDKESIARLKVKAICGGANNQLAGPEDGDRLRDRGITWAPDYLVNAGGAIAAAAMAGVFSDDEAHAKIDNIFATTREILARSANHKVSPDVAAAAFAQELLAKAP